MRIEIVNVVATSDIGESIDLDEISRMPQVIYNPSKYRCAYFKDDGMQAKVSIFPSGKMIAVGAKSEETARRDLLHVTQLLGVNIGTIKVEIRNVVATVDLETAINLEALQDVVPGIIYEPEQFPGAIFRPARHPVTVLIFGSGKLVLAGLKTSESLSDIVQNIVQELNLRDFA